MEKLSVECRPVTAETLPALLRFMGERAFSDNPHWATCYCVFHYLTDAEGGTWHDRTGTQNRTLLATMAEGGTGHWVAAHDPDDDRVVGYVNADMRPRLLRYDEWGVPSEPDVAILACFVVDPTLRRRGVATQLLDAAADAMWSRGAARLDAYTIADTAKAASEWENEDGIGEDQHAHHGPLAMYLAAGFRVIGTDGPFAHVVRDRPTFA